MITRLHDAKTRAATRLDPFAFGRTRSDPALLLLQARATSILHPIGDAFGLSARQCRDVIAWHEARRAGDGGGQKETAPMKGP